MRPQPRRRPRAALHAGARAGASTKRSRHSPRPARASATAPSARPIPVSAVRPRCRRRRRPVRQLPRWRFGLVWNGPRPPRMSPLILAPSTPLRAGRSASEGAAKWRAQQRTKSAIYRRTHCVANSRAANELRRSKFFFETTRRAHRLCSVQAHLRTLVGGPCRSGFPARRGLDRSSRSRDRVKRHRKDLLLRIDRGVARGFPCTRDLPVPIDRGTVANPCQAG